MTLMIAAMPAYNEGHVIVEVVEGCKKYVDRILLWTITTCITLQELQREVYNYKNRNIFIRRG